MTGTNTDEKKTRLERLSTRKAEIEAALKKEQARVKLLERKAKTAENAKARKAEARLKIEYGGLISIAGMLGTDKGLLLGMLLAGAQQVKEKGEAAVRWKQRGDAVLADRERERKKKEAETDPAPQGQEPAPQEKPSTPALALNLTGTDYKSKKEAMFGNRL